MDEELQPAPERARVNPVAFALAAVGRFHLLIVLMVGIGLAGGLFVAATTPNQYRSLGKLFVRSGIRENLTVESAISGADASNSMRIQGAREAILNELQVLSAPQLYDKIVARVGAETLLAPYDPTWGVGEDAPWSTRLFHGFQSWWFGSSGAALDLDGFDKRYFAAKLLERTIIIEPETGASVINVMHQADSPAKAKMVVDAVLAAAQEMHKEVFSLFSSLATVETEQAAAELDARNAEDELRKFRLEHEVYDFDSQRQDLLGYLTEFERQCDAADLEIRRRQAERDVLNRILGTVPEKRAIDGQVTVNPEFTRLTALIGQLELQLLQLDLSRAASGDSGGLRGQRELVERMLSSTRTALEQEKPTIDPPLMDHPRRERIVESLDAADVALDGLQKQRQQLDQSRTAMKGRLAQFDALEPALRKLEIEARQKRDKSDTYARGVASLKTVQRLDQMNLSNISVMHEGTYNPTKVAPVRSKLLLLGAFGGGCFGMLLALGLAYIDREVRGRLDLQRAGIALGAIVRSRGGADGDPFAEGAGDSAHLWTRLAYDRRETAGIQVAVVPSGGRSDASVVAADLAIGLARHGGEKVVLVCCVAGPTPFESRANLAAAPGWRDALAGERSLASVVQTTPVPGLSYVGCGEAAEGMSHAAASRRLLEMLDQLRREHRFVVLQVADVESEPESRGLLAISEAALVVASVRGVSRAQVADAVKAVEASGAALVAGVLQSQTSA